MRKLRRNRRGSALILAVAVLTLLAVMGTVYLVTSRLYVQSLNGLTEDDYFDMASEEFLNTIQQRILDDQWVSDTTTKLPYFQYDPISPGNGSGIGTTNTNRETAWLCRSILPGQTDDSPTSTIASPARNISVISQYAYNPNTQKNDIDNDASVGLRFSVLEGASAVDRVYLTTTQAPSGTRYRFAVRIVDTNRMANLNISSPGTGADPEGTYVTGVPLVSLPLGSDSANIHTNSSQKGRAGTSGLAYSARTWDAVAMTPEVPSFFTTGGSVGARENLYNTLGLTPNTLVNPFTIEDELGLRRYDSLLATETATRLSGLSTVLTMSASNAGRSLYTTYSFDRSLRRVLTYDASGNATATYGDPVMDVSTNVVEPYAFTLNANLTVPLKDSNNTIQHWQVWPSRDVGGKNSSIIMPVKININNNVPAPISANVYADADNGPSLVAATATALASAMKKINYGGSNTYTFDEYAAVAVNYINARYAAGTDPTVSATTPYTLPYGPSLMDEFGLLVRGASRNTSANFVVRDFAGAATNKDLHTDTNEMIVGYAPQPFLNEVAVSFKHDGAATPQDTILDFAVEIANPYPVALSVGPLAITGSQGWKIKLYKTDWTLISSIDLSTANGGKIAAAGAGLGYLVVGQTGTKFSITPAATDATFIPETTGAFVVLTRPVIKRRADQTLAAIPASDIMDMPVDVMEIPASMLSQTTDGEDIKSLERYAPSGTNLFQCNSAKTIISTDAAKHTLTAVNSNTRNDGLELFDRFVNTSFPATMDAGDPFDNLADFNRNIVRIANHVKFDTTANVWKLLPADSFAGKVEAMSLTYGDITSEAKARFNFLDGVRDSILLEYLSSGDRATNERIIANALRPADKVRIPGRINVNTAPATILNALLTEVGADPTQQSAFVTARTTFPPTTAPIATSGQLLTAFQATGTPATLYDRDLIFARLLNRVTFSSDTFVVYVYGESVKRSSTYTGIFNDAGDWYTAVGTGTRLEKKKERRFVAILDRSVCNYPVGGSNYVTPTRVATIIVSPP